MTLREWFKINPDHRVLLVPSMSGTIRAVLKGGDGIDERLVGEGETETQAIQRALETRDLIAGRLSGGEAS